MAQEISGDKEKYRGLDPLPPEFVAEYPPIALVIEEKCIACERCPPVCFFDAIVMEERPKHPFQGTAVISPENCTGCGLCFEACPVEAIVWVPDKNPASIAARPSPPPSEERENADF